MPYTAPSAFTTRPDLTGTFGMTASTHWLATATGQAVLERGGNAFDAAVAAAFVLHLVEPHLNGPGGDLVAILATAEEPGEPVVLMGQGPAPEGASIERFRAEGLDLVPGAGALAAAVPGAVDAWLLLLETHGTWEPRDVLAYAVGYARDGHPLTAGVARSIAAMAPFFREHWPTSAERWLAADGTPPTPGTIVADPAWAAVLDELVAAGDALGPEATRPDRVRAARHEWATGRVAAEIDAFVREPHRHSSGTDHAGVLRASDLAAFRASFEPALVRSFRGVEVAKSGPWGQGPALLEMLAILEPLPDEALDPSTALGAHTAAEAIKLAMADREAFFGDSDAPVDALLAPEAIAARRALIGDRASAELRPFLGALDALPRLRTAEEYSAGVGGVGEPTVESTGDLRGDTCHLDVVDRWGNIVAATPSGGWLQSSPTIPALGFCLGTRLQMTWLDERSPSALRPGRRPRTTLTPTLLLRDGRAIAALGSPGGDQQDQWQLLYLLRTLVGGWSPQAAIDAPALHTTSFPGSFWPRTWDPGGLVVEDDLGEDVIRELEARGHVVTRAGARTLGRLSTVGRDPGTGVVHAAANARAMQGYAAGR